MFALIFSLITFAHADNTLTTNARFTYPAALPSFASGAAPSVATLTAQPWMIVGVASHSSQDASNDGYWPDGNVVDQGQSGYFHTFVTISSVTDAFGGSALNWHVEHVGAESGKVYSSADLPGSLSSTSLLVQIANTSSTCGADRECRLVASGRLLLCATKVTDPLPSCGHTPSGQPNYFTAYVPKN